MSIGRATLSVIGKLLIIVVIGAAFVGAFFWTLKASLYSPEVTVPNIVGKEVGAGESELEATGLNMRRRATRYSADVKPNTILDQSPHAGEIIKSGQTVAVVISRSTANEGESSVPVSSETPEANTNSNTPANTNTNTANNANNANNKNRNKNKNSNANNSNNSNNRNANANNRNNNSNRNANSGNSNRSGNNNNGGNRNSNPSGNRNTNSGNRTNTPARGNANGPGRDRVVNSNRN